MVPVLSIAHLPHHPAAWKRIGKAGGLAEALLPELQRRLLGLSLAYGRAVVVVEAPGPVADALAQRGAAGLHAAAARAGLALTLLTSPGPEVSQVGGGGGRRRGRVCACVCVCLCLHACMPLPPSRYSQPTWSCRRLRVRRGRAAVMS